MPGQRRKQTRSADAARATRRRAGHASDAARRRTAKREGRRDTRWSDEDE